MTNQVYSTKTKWILSMAYRSSVNIQNFTFTLQLNYRLSQAYPSYSVLQCSVSLNEGNTCNIRWEILNFLSQPFYFFTVLPFQIKDGVNALPYLFLSMISYVWLNRQHQGKNLKKIGVRKLKKTIGIFLWKFLEHR